MQFPKPTKQPKKEKPKPRKNKPTRIINRVALREAYCDYCQLCGQTGVIQVHHIIYRSHGGGDIPDNLISLCLSCHDDAHGRGGNGLTPKRVLYQAREADNADNR